MNKEIDQFSPTVATIKEAVSKADGLSIKGVDDEAGYAQVKVVRKELGDLRIDITKFGKKLREEAIAKQRWVISKEKELLAMIEPTETKLKGELDAIDDQKKIEERKILLPARIKMLEELGIVLLDAEILRMDESEFSAYYAQKKFEFLEKAEAAEKEAREKKERAAEIEQAKNEAVELAIQAERDKSDKERKAREQAEIEVVEEAMRKADAIKADQAKTEKNKKYKAWLKKNGWTQKRNIDFIIQRTDNTFKIFKIIDQITIQ